ncbi:hypothetical protein D8Y22_08415 [Salinadaptatus halalkaliphilus]|uniref:Formyl transferase N-terminal domain-containing protein n=1 Tax=Salinadaptatus halalkaliphilus TaxID=2419781 RepID=A0A4V3VLD0_9EURY|nr:formyltransferase family protein [Salinadaptatus halalkaliphilus]THE65227.1 hypothetical protein D8Y22_08415 [Salinadaptatus halalkaliphilus]
MTVWLFTSEEPLYLPRYLDPILREHADVIEQVVVAPPAASSLAVLRSQYGQFGLVNGLRMGSRFARGAVLGKLPPAWQRYATGRLHSVRSVAADHGVPVRYVADVTDTSFVSSVRESEPDLILSIICGQLLEADLLSIPDRAINVHGSLLPKYRGRATAFWPLYYDDDRTGVTAHLMTTRFDAGPIVEQRSFSIDETDTMDDCYRRLAAVGSDLAIDLLERLPDLDLETRPNPIEEGTYRSVPSVEQRRAFLRRGNRFV